MKDALLNFFDNKNILILGFGREGKSLYDFLTQNQSTATVSVADKNQLEDIRQVSDTENLDQYDHIVKSPGYFLPEDFQKKPKQRLPVSLIYSSNSVQRP